ncbi:MAG: tetratricopeptide repeat protein [Candidatus Sulfotelmatobacter sp.]
MSVRHSLVNFVLISAVAAALACSLASAQTQNFAALHKQAKEGNAEAQYELAKDYYTGTGVPKDSKQGLEWLRKSADQGHPGAEFALAVLYRKGELKDPKQGLVWLQKSAAHNNAAAEYELGCLFRDGEGGVSKNPHEAALWLRKAARQKNEPAQNGLEQMLRKGTISRQEANWRGPDLVAKTTGPAILAKSEPKPDAKTENSKPFSLLEIEKGLQGGITCKRLATLVDKFKVDFSLSDDVRQRLSKAGADDNLLATISASRRAL